MSNELLTQEGIKTLLKGERIMKKMAASFIRYKTLRVFAKQHNTSEEDIENYFIEFPHEEDRFNDAVYEQSKKLAYRAIRAGVPEAIAKLNELITDPEEDATNAYKSSSALLNTWTKIDNIQPERCKTEEEMDDLDLIWQEVVESAKEKETNTDTDK